MKEFIKKLTQNILECFAPKFIPWHLVAILLTYLSVSSGFDWYYFVEIQDLELRKLLFPALLIGAVLPIIIPLIMIVFGKTRGIKKMFVTGEALAQSAFMGSLISSLYKAFTGRIQPDFSNVMFDNSRHFNFGFWENGIFWGWPSSHTTIAFAMAVTLFVLYSNHKFARNISIIYALYIGIGVTIGVHWFSEFIAGAIIGSIIGIVVGKSFLPKNVD